MLHTLFCLGNPTATTTERKAINQGRAVASVESSYQISSSLVGNQIRLPATKSSTIKFTSKVLSCVCVCQRKRKTINKSRVHFCLTARKRVNFRLPFLPPPESVSLKVCVLNPLESQWLVLKW